MVQTGGLISVQSILGVLCSKRMRCLLSARVPGCNLVHAKSNKSKRHQDWKWAHQRVWQHTHSLPLENEGRFGGTSGFLIPRYSLQT